MKLIQLGEGLQVVMTRQPSAFEKIPSGLLNDLPRSSNINETIKEKLDLTDPIFEGVSKEIQVVLPLSNISLDIEERSDTVELAQGAGDVPRPERQVTGGTDPLFPDPERYVVFEQLLARANNSSAGGRSLSVDIVAKPVFSGNEIDLMRVVQSVAGGTLFYYDVSRHDRDWFRYDIQESTSVGPSSKIDVFGNAAIDTKLYRDIRMIFGGDLNNNFTQQYAFTWSTRENFRF